MKGIFLDIETTGLDPLTHRPIDLAFQVRDLQEGNLLAEYQSLVKYPKEVWERSDPESARIHQYTWQMTQKGKEPAAISDEVIALFDEFRLVRGKAFFICQNPGFDRSFFCHIVPSYTQENHNWPYHWLDLASMYWTTHVQSLTSQGLALPSQINLSKNAIAKTFNLPPEKKPHQAMNGVEHLVACYSAVLRLAW